MALSDLPALSDVWALAGLFGSAFVSATLIPGPSEAVLIALIALGSVPVWLAVAVATVGNTLGSLVNWAMGRFALRYRDRSWFPASEEQLAKSRAWFERWGVWALLFAWVPVVGDALTVAAGLLRVSPITFTALVGIGKLARYIVVAWLARQVV